MDGLYAVLMMQRGAQEVLAFDRKNRERHIWLIKEIFGQSFTYYPGTRLENVPLLCKRHFKSLADFVNFSRILYHLFDPMRGIALVGGMVRNGEVVLLDTPAITATEPIMYYNYDWRFYGPGTYFAPTIFLLEQMIRFMGFDIIDGFYQNQSWLNKMRQHRIFLVLRATHFPILTDDTLPSWVADYTLDDFSEFIDLGELWKQDDANVNYEFQDGGFGRFDGTLLEYVTNGRETPFREEDMFLVAPPN